MKNIALLIVVVVFTCLGLSAQSIGYRYDKAGNRISTYIIVSKAANSEGAEGAFALNDSPSETFDYGNEGKTLIFPNPTAGLVQMKIELPAGEMDYNVHVKVYSLNGNLILDEKHNSGKFEIDLTEHVNGSYFLDLFVNGRKQVYTIIKK